MENSYKPLWKMMIGKDFMKKDLAAMAVIVLASVIICLCAIGNATAEITSGKWGTCAWEINDEGVLTIHEGMGGSIVQPWQSLRSQITSVVATERIVLPRYANELFKDLSNAVSMDLSGFVTDNVKEMKRMFENCEQLTTLDLGSFNTGSVTNMQYMFNGCYDLTSLNLSSFNTAYVTDMRGMFKDCYTLISLDLSNFNTANVTSMYDMFCSCYALTNMNLSSFDTSNVVGMNEMFRDCSKLKSLDLSNFNTSNVSNMTSMFSGCYLLNSLDVSSFDTSSVSMMTYMFSRCQDLTSLDLSNFNTAAVLDMHQMFQGCRSLATLNLSGFNTGGVKNMGGMFSDCDSLSTVTFGRGFSFVGDGSGEACRLPDKYWISSMDGNLYTSREIAENRSNTEDTYKADTSYQGIARGESGTCKWEIDAKGVLTIHAGIIENLQTGSIWRQWSDQIVTVVGTEDVVLPENTVALFSGLMSCTEMNLSGFNTANVKYMDRMFEQCDSLTFLDLSNFDTSNVKSMSSMFFSCQSLTNVDLSSFNTSNVTTMYGMFNSCSSLTNVDLSSFDTSKVTDMEYMFYRCSNLNTVTLGESFSFYGSGITLLGKLPDNYWISTTDGNTYTSRAIAEDRSHLADTYTVDSSYTGIARGEWGTCLWEINEEYVLTIHAGVGEDITLATGPWWNWSTSITAVIATENIVLPADSGNLFEDFYSAYRMDLSGFDTSNVTDMSNMFEKCYQLTSLDVSGFVTSKVTTMSSMFRYCTSLPSLDLSNFTTDSVTKMSSMFEFCESLTTIDLSGFRTEAVKNMNSMFYGCSSLVSADLSNFNTVNVQSIEQMFSHCTALSSLDLSSFNTANAIYMESMFAGCTSLTTVTLGSKFSFTGRSSDVLCTLPDRYWVSSETGVIYSSLEIAENRNKIADVYTADTGFAGIARGEWGTCKWEIDNEGILTIHAGTLDDIYSVGSPWSVWSSQITSVNASEPIILPTNSNRLFENFSSVTSMDLSGFNTSQVTNMEYMFCQCKNLISLDLSSFDTTNVENMGKMFRHCSTLTRLNLDHFITTNVTDMSGMFDSCIGLTALNLGNFNTENVTTMSEMFWECTSLTSLNLSNFITTKVTGMAYMFYKCSSMKTLDLSRFSTEKVNYIRNMFDGCDNLTMIILGKDFSFYGNNSTVPCLLPDKEWVSGLDGGIYTAEEIATSRNNLADTYTVPIDLSEFTHVVRLPQGLTSIHAEAFVNTNFEAVYIPDTVTFIEDTAFEQNPGIVLIFTMDSPLLNWVKQSGYRFYVME